MEDAKKLSRGVGFDMTPEAISRRLDIASQLYELVNCLGGGKKLGPAQKRSDLHILCEDKSIA